MVDMIELSRGKNPTPGDVKTWTFKNNGPFPNPNQVKMVYSLHVDIGDGKIWASLFHGKTAGDVTDLKFAELTLQDNGDITYKELADVYKVTDLYFPGFSS
eukprot:UC4_evm1s819